MAAEESWASSIGIDTGGTFTDMVVFDPATGEVDSLKTSSTPATPGQAIVNALDEGGVAAAEHRHVHARDDRRHERADRAHGLQGRLRDDEGLRGHAVHPADQPQGALRPALDEAGAARREPAPLPRRARSGSIPKAPRCRPVDEDEVRELAAQDPRRRAPRRWRSASSSPTSTPSTRSASRRSSPRSCRECPISVSSRGRADLARVRALVDHDRRRLPAAAVRPLRRQPRRRAPRRGHDARRGR